MKHVVAFMILLSLLIATNTFAAIAQSDFDDGIANNWRLRSEAASKRLSMDGLDECDKAFERAFLRPEVLSSKSGRIFKINFEVAGAQLNAAYTFTSGRLEFLQVLNLPAGWIAWQRAENKTLSVFVPTAKCVIDICTNNPFGPGLCAGEKLE